jgi:rod shape determining protein RodA
MNFLYDCAHNLSERIRYSKWQLILLPILFSIIGIYVGISTFDRDFIPYKNFAVENMLLPLIFFAVGFLLPVSLWRRYAVRFSAGQHILWNREGFSFAFILFLIAIFLQVMAIWGDKSWDRIPIDNARLNLKGYYMEAELRSINENSYSVPKDAELARITKNNGITQLRRHLSIFSRPFQVGELVKIFCMIFVAKLLTDMRINRQMKMCKEFIGFPVLVLLPICFFTFLMPNYSMLIIYALLVFFMLFVQEMNLKPRIFLIVILAIPCVMAFSVQNLDKDNAIVRVHGINRIWAFFHEDRAGNEQQNEALQALADGGIKGKGLDKGTIKHHLFGARNDFAYSILGEELGLLRMLPITIALMGFLLTCFWIAGKVKIQNTPHSNYNPKDRDIIFAQNLAWGIAMIFSLNIFFHIGVNLRLLPNTGQPLSFISSGGTNLVMNFFLMGMLVQISSLNMDKEA